ncbi:MAG TPA: SemiSWEET transporter [Usitatibacter sp.]|nr:SemiSWEET transporter [Usitatibacter sp.]
MDATTIVGFTAGFLTTFAFVPQVRKIWKTRSAKDVSLPTFIAFSVGVALWLGYGFMKGEPPMILWNGVTLVLAMAILVMKVKFG